MSHCSRGAWIEIWKALLHLNGSPSRIAHAVRGLKSLILLHLLLVLRRIAHAVRGLKFANFFDCKIIDVSHCSRGAWIEISDALPAAEAPKSRIAHAVRGLK